MEARREVRGLRSSRERWTDREKEGGKSRRDKEKMKPPAGGGAAGGGGGGAHV